MHPSLLVHLGVLDEVVFQELLDRPTINFLLGQAFIYEVLEDCPCLAVRDLWGWLLCDVFEEDFGVLTSCERRRT